MRPYIDDVQICRCHCMRWHRYDASIIDRHILWPHQGLSNIRIYLGPNLRMFKSSTSSIDKQSNSLDFCYFERARKWLPVKDLVNFNNTDVKSKHVYSIAIKAYFIFQFFV